MLPSLLCLGLLVMTCSTRLTGAVAAMLEGAPNREDVQTAVSRQESAEDVVTAMLEGAVMLDEAPTRDDLAAMLEGAPARGDDRAAILKEIKRAKKCGVLRLGFCEKFTDMQMVSPALMDNKTYQASLCFCDDECALFRDCCADRADLNTTAAHDDVTSHVLGIPRSMWRCQQLNLHGVEPKLPSYIVSECPPGHLYAEQCSHAAETSSDYLQDVPVMVAHSGVWFRNVYCAVCHGAAHDLAPINTVMQCSDPDVVTQDALAERIKNGKYITGSLRWEWGGNSSNYCRLQLTPAQWGVNQSVPGFYRPCVRVIDTCAATWRDERVAEKCRQFSYLLMENVTEIYKNHYCAVCNNVPPNRLKCWDHSSTRGVKVIEDPILNRRMFASLSILLFKPSSRDLHACSLPHAIYDAIHDRCQPIMTLCASGYRYYGHKCIPHTQEDLQVSSNYTLYDVNVTSEFASCPKSSLAKSEFQILSNGSLLLTLKTSENSNRVFQEDEYQVLNDSTAIVCKVLKTDYVPPSSLMQNSKAEGILTMICLVVSIICLILHIAVYSTVPKLRNLPGKNLLALSWALLVAQLVFLLGVHPVTHLPRGACATVAVIIHYFYLSAFCWMNVMSYDIWRKFSSSLRQSNDTSTNMHRKYSVYAWGFPLVVVTLAVLTEVTSVLPTEARPGYGLDGICWFGTRVGLGIFLSIPMAVILVANLVFFGITVAKIRRQKRESARYLRDTARVELVQTKKRTSVMVDGVGESVTVAPTQKVAGAICGRRDKVHLYLYLKLFTIMGLSWLFGIVAALADVPVLYYPFVVLNGLQGCFIFFMFDWKRSIGAAVWERAVGGKYVTPSFLIGSTTSRTDQSNTTSTSASSGRRSRNVSDNRTSSTLYVSDVGQKEADPQQQLRARLGAVVYADIQEEEHNTNNTHGGEEEKPTSYKT